jgi:hypothetical protein
MAKKKKEITIEDCVLDALNLQSKLQELYYIKTDSSLYSELIVLEQLVRNLKTLTNKLQNNNVRK